MFTVLFSTPYGHHNGRILNHCTKDTFRHQATLLPEFDKTRIGWQPKKPIGLNLLSYSLKVTLCRSVAVLSIKTFRVLRVIFECSPERNRSYVSINTYTLGMSFCRSIFFQVQCRMNKYYLSAAQYGWMAVEWVCSALLIVCLFNLSLMTYIRAVHILWTPLYFKHLCIIWTSLHSIDTFPYCGHLSFMNAICKLWTPHHVYYGHLSIMNAICILWTPLHTVDTSTSWMQYAYYGHLSILWTPLQAY